MTEPKLNVSVEELAEWLRSHIPHEWFTTGSIPAEQVMARERRVRSKCLRQARRMLAAEKLWPEIGNVLDHWEQLPNDLRGEMEALEAALVRLYREVHRGD